MTLIHPGSRYFRLPAARSLRRCPGHVRSFLPLSLLLVAISIQQSSAQTTGPRSSASPYVLPSIPGAQTISIMTVGDSVNLKPDGVTPYRAVGIMDGFGGFRTNADTFTLLMNHELPVNLNALVGTPVGIVREHLAAGALVSQWSINPDTLQVIEVEDMLQATVPCF